MRESIKIASVVLVLAGCSSGGGSPTGSGGGSNSVSTSGHWSYVLPSLPNIGAVVDVTLTENSQGAISGTGQIYDTNHYNAVVSGTRSGSTVNLTATTSVCTAVFSGSFSDNNTITGTAVAQNAATNRDCRQGTWTLKRQ